MPRDANGLPVIGQMPTPPTDNPPMDAPPQDQPTLPVVGDPRFWQLLPEVILINLLDPVHWLAALPVIAAAIASLMTHLPPGTPLWVLTVMAALDAALQAWQATQGSSATQAAFRRVRARLALDAAIKERAAIQSTTRSGARYESLPGDGAVPIFMRR